MFKSSFYQDLALSEWLTHLPPELVLAHLGIDKATLDAMPKDEVVVMPKYDAKVGLPVLRPRSVSTEPARKRSEAETTTDCRSKVVVGVIGNAGAMRNGDGQTAADPGIRNSGKTVETFGEVMIHIERPLIERARAGRAETGRGRAGRRITEVVLPLLIPREGEVGFLR